MEMMDGVLLGNPVSQWLIALGAGVLAVIVLANRFGRGFIWSISIALGLMAGYVVAALLGRVDFTGLAVNRTSRSTSVLSTSRARATRSAWISSITRMARAR